jgi:hypothetical protein
MVTALCDTGKHSVIIRIGRIGNRDWHLPADLERGQQWMTIQINQAMAPSVKKKVAPFPLSASAQILPL